MASFQAQLVTLAGTGQEGEVSSGDRSVLNFILKIVMYVCHSIRERADMLVKANYSGKDVSPRIMIYGPGPLNVPVVKFFDLCHVNLFLSLLCDPSAVAVLLPLFSPILCNLSEQYNFLFLLLITFPSPPLCFPDSFLCQIVRDFLNSEFLCKL